MPVNSFKQQGSAAITVIMAVMLLAVICLTFAGLTLNNMTMATEFQSGLKTQYAAEAAAKLAIATFDRSTPNWSTVASGNIAGATYQVVFSPPLSGSTIPISGSVYQVRVKAKYKKSIKNIQVTVTKGATGVKSKVTDWKLYTP